jgi:hypothetical protein
MFTGCSLIYHLPLALGDSLVCYAQVAVLGPSDLLSTEVVWSISDSERLVNVFLEEKDGMAAAVYFVQVNIQ